MSIPRIHNWGAEVESALTVVLAAEGETFQNRTPNSREFVKVHRWLVAVDAIPRFLRSRFALPGLANLLSEPLIGHLVAVSRLLGRTGQIASYADAILFKSNLRAFYPAHGITIKASNPARVASSARVVHEMKARKRLVPGRYMRVPELIASGSVNSDYYLAERLVERGTGKNHARHATGLAVDLVDFHLRNGVSTRRLKELPQLSDAWTALREKAKDSDLRLSQNLGRRVTDLLGSAFVNREVLVCLCNGDLTSSNLLMSGDSTYLIDWEWAMEAPLFVDAVKLSTQIDGFADAFVNSLRLSEVSSSANLLALTDQFLLATLLVAATRISRATDFHRMSDERAYAYRLAARLADFIRLMESLARQPADGTRQLGGHISPALSDSLLWHSIH